MNTINREWFSLELFKVSFDPAALGNLLGDEIVQMTLPFEALFEPLKSTSNLGGFGNFVHQLFDYFDLSSSDSVVRDGDTFTITFGTSETDFPYPYTITGVTSADIGGEPLTGTFAASGEQLTFTVVNTLWSKFRIALDNGKAFVEVKLQKIDPETYVITFIDTTSLSATEINNINIAINQLRALLATNVYGSTELANKYVKAPINKDDERYMIWPASDYRDNVSEPKKYLFLAFVDESNDSYHAIPRNITIEPTATWTADFNTFDAIYPDFEIFNYLIFSPTGTPANSSEIAFNAHIIDVVAGNNGYPAMSAYNFTAKPNWNENSTGQETYDAIIEFIS